MDNQQKDPNTLMDVLKSHLPGAAEKMLTTLAGEIKAMYEDQQGFRMQWRTKLTDVINPEDADKPKDQQRVMFRFEVRAGDFFNPSVELHNFSFQYRIKDHENGGAKA